jgi:AraC-like DNA-binding protein
MTPVHPIDARSRHNDYEIPPANQNSASGEVKHCGPKTALRVEQSIAHMEQHLNQPLPVAVLAAQAGFTPSYFFHAFKRRTGSTPKNYFTRLRMQRACQLLEGSLLNVKEVASKLGYSDPLYFSRVFKSVKGVAPSDYRAAHRGMGGKTVENGGVFQMIPAHANLSGALPHGLWKSKLRQTIPA